MTHRSRVCAFGFDTAAEQFEETASFWSQALGRRADQVDEAYTLLRGADHLYFVQRIGEGAPRIHVDIETDDVAAEVARLEKLGAKRVRQVEGWWVMEDPGGHVFCVVPVQSETWPSGATEWNE